MDSVRPSRAGAVALVVLLTVSALLASACGGSDDSGSEPDGGAVGEAAEPAAPERPEGEWTLVRWTTARSDTDDPPRVASEQRLRFTPSCDEGPCDLELSPAGADGSYYPEGYPLEESATPNTDAVEVRWNPEGSAYEWQTEPSTTSCTTADGQTIPEGYDVSTRYELTFEPGDANTPPSIQGVGTFEAKGTPESGPRGCSDFTETLAVAAAPTDAFSGEDSDLAGEYVVTEIVEATEPADQRPRGFRGVLFPAAKITAEGDGFTVAGVLSEPALLEQGADGWNGSTSAAQGTCQDGVQAPQYDATETWTDVLQVATTESGPVLSGRWELREEPNETGFEAGCSARSNTGWVIFVPSGATAG